MHGNPELAGAKRVRGDETALQVALRERSDSGGSMALPVPQSVTSFSPHTYTTEV